MSCLRPGGQKFGARAGERLGLHQGRRDRARLLASWPKPWPPGLKGLTKRRGPEERPDLVQIRSGLRTAAFRERPRSSSAPSAPTRDRCGLAVPPLCENRRGAGLRPLQRERFNPFRRVVTVAKALRESPWETLHARPIVRRRQPVFTGVRKCRSRSMGLGAKGSRLGRGELWLTERLSTCAPGSFSAGGPGLG